MIVLFIILCDDVGAQLRSKRDAFSRRAVVDVENHNFACFPIFHRHVPGL